MKNLQIMCCLLAAIALSGCKSCKKETDANAPAPAAQQASAQAPETSAPQAPAAQPVAEENIQAPMNESVLILHPDQNGHASMTVKKRAGFTLYFQFDSGDYKKFTAKVTPAEEGGNVRFAQIIYPDHSADGPFGMELTHKLSKKGAYQLAVNENIMAGDPWKGVFTIEVQLKK